MHVQLTVVLGYLEYFVPNTHPQDDTTLSDFECEIDFNLARREFPGE